MHTAKAGKAPPYLSACRSYECNISEVCVSNDIVTKHACPTKKYASLLTFGRPIAPSGEVRGAPRCTRHVDAGGLDKARMESYRGAGGVAMLRISARLMPTCYFDTLKPMRLQDSLPFDLLPSAGGP